MLDLQPFAVCFRQFLVVRHFAHDVGDRDPELFDQLVIGRLRVLERVVKQSGGQHDRIGHSAFADQNLSQAQRVVDVRRSGLVLATLIAMLMGGERGCLDDELNRWRTGVSVHARDRL